MRILSVSSLILVVALMVLSAYLRLDNSGIGCEPWPTCYGNIGIAGKAPDALATYDRLVREAQEPLSWATPAHRLVASVLGLFILAMTILAIRQRKNRRLTIALLLLTVFLAWLGIYSEGLHSPAIVMGNLCGGFAMLGLLGWAVLRKPDQGPTHTGKLQVLTSLALITLCLQIFVGGLTSANFAASACQTIPDCHGTWLPGSSLETAFDLTRTHRINDSGMVLGGVERAAIHKLHRLFAVLTTIVIIAAGFAALSHGGKLRYAGISVIALVTLELSLGVAAVVGDLPIGVAVAHNWLAALLLLGLLKIYADAQAGSVSAAG